MEPYDLRVFAVPCILLFTGREKESTTLNLNLLSSSLSISLTVSFLMDLENVC